MQRRSRGISTVIGIAILILIFVAFIAFIFISMQYIEKLTELSSKMISARARASSLSQALHGWWLVEGNDLVINISNRYPQAVLITAIGIVFENGDYIAIAKNMRYPPNRNIVGTVTIRDTTGHISSQPLSLPIALGSGYSVNITLENIALSQPKLISITVSASPVSIALPLKNYYEVYPPTQPVAVPNITYSLVYAPIAIPNYTVAILGYNATESSPTTPTGYSIDVGNYISGDTISLQSIDGNTLRVESVAHTHYRFPDFREWRYYKPITITEQTGQDLPQYTVKIVLDSTNFDFSKAKPDGSDIRFILEDGTVLNYWIEKWDSTNQQAVVWVKIPLIPGGQTMTIYMLYGNPNADFDPRHYGLTKVMEQLPASDGPNYKIQYQEWIMPTSGLIGGGTAQRWHADDGAWRLNLPFNFPYYNTYISYLYVCSNGFVSTVRNTDFSDSVGELISRRMIAPFWEDLMTYSPHDIYVRTDYSDEYGRAVVIRWYTNFYWGYGEANFELVLYENGLIRFNYGYIDGRPWDRPTVGISFGDGTHYTISSYNDKQADWYNHRNSVMFWPRKVATTEPSVEVDPNDYDNVISGYMVRIELGWSGITPTTIVSSSFYVKVEASGGRYTYTIYENSTGEWTPLASDTIATNTWVNIRVDVYRFYASGTAGLALQIFGDQPFVLDIDYAEIRYKVLGDPLLAIAVNNSRYLYLFNLRSGSWLSVDVGAMRNPAIAYDYQFMKFVLVNGTHLLSYDPYTAELQVLTAVEEVSHSSAFLAVTRWFIAYSPGNASSSLYIYDREGSLVATASLPLAVTPYTCSAYAMDRDRIYVLYGVIGKLYNISVTQYGEVNIEEITVSPSIPTLYPVGLDYDYRNGYLWIIGRGGGIHRIDLSTNSVDSLDVQPPYYPLSEGDRLVCYENKLIHVREDGTSEIWIISIRR